MVLETDEIPMENKDLLVPNKPYYISKTESNGRLPNNRVSNEPPDGGFRAYTVIIGSFLTNGILFGVINSYSVIHEVLKSRLTEDNVPNPDTRAGNHLLFYLYLE